jgi:hypothetical protein
MTRTSGASAAFACIIAPWAAEFIAVLGAIVEIIRTIAEKIRNTLPELGARCREAGSQLPAFAAGAVSPDDVEARLPAVSGERAPCRRLPAGARIRAGCHENLRRPREARSKTQFATPSAIEPWRGLMAILARTGLDDDMGSERGHVPT